MQKSDDVRRGFIRVAEDLSSGAGADGLTVGEIADRLDERAFGLLILVLTLPCLVPGLPGAQVIAVGIFLLAAQMLLGREEPWLPGWFLGLRVRKSWLDAVAGFARRRLAFIETLSRPRLLFLADGMGARMAAFFMAVAAITVMAPITNTIPSIGLTLCALGFVQRDGLLTLAGVIVCALWSMLLAGVIAAVWFGAGYLLDAVREATPFLDMIWDRLPG